jgi:hypothetical protein
VVREWSRDGVEAQLVLGGEATGRNRSRGAALYAFIIQQQCRRLTALRDRLAYC